VADEVLASASTKSGALCIPIVPEGHRHLSFSCVAQAGPDALIGVAFCVDMTRYAEWFHAR
jgi:hypothetical protein